ncbi:PP2C family protein-serine/threonine phosphatase [Algivirga pacifica]|uniref:PPM-type phosphatase domain-containing protein n=1 Tax=Algivirga pacifica TaxID=1162670 RepID=A0ABP9CWP0_9BACT
MGEDEGSTFFTVERGVLDLRTVDLQQTEGIIKGEWEFYYNQLINPEDFKQNINLPTYVSPWTSWSELTNEQEGGNYPTLGHATYRLRILHQKGIDEMAIHMPGIGSSYNLFVDGKLYLSNGKIGTSRETSTPFEVKQTGAIELRGVQSEIVLQVSNYHHGTGGGFGQPAILGPADALFAETVKDTSSVYLLVGGLLLMGLFFWVIHIFWKYDRSIRHFAYMTLALACWFIFREDRNFLLFFPLSWEWETTLEYIFMYIALYHCIEFYAKIFPGDYFSKAAKVLRWLTLGFIVVTVILPAYIFTTYTFVHNIVAAVYVGLCGVYMIQKVYQRAPFSGFVMIGLTVLAINVIYMELIQYKLIYTNNRFQAIGFLTFILSQSLILAYKFSALFIQERILSEKNQVQSEELEQQAEQLSTFNQLLQQQKEQLQHANTQMVSSFNAALQIQQAMLPHIDRLKEKVQDTFVLWKPKDVVGGDFYWFKDTGDHIIIAVVDCTGHGVSGALMSMSASNMLHEITGKGIYTPDKILQEMHRKALDQFQQDKVSNMASMDAGIVVINKVKSKLQYAGARVPLLYCDPSEEELLRIKPTKISLGQARKDKKVSFSYHSIPLKKGTTFYMFTDGYQDQFGGPNDRKFSISQLERFLNDIKDKPMGLQQLHLMDRHNTWKGEKGFQIDDMLVLGVRI